MSHVVISHAIGTHGAAIWYPHLSKQLEQLGHTVAAPDLPDSTQPQPGPWLDILRAAVSDAAPPDTVLIGHSLGAVNILRLLEQHDGPPYKGIVLVAAMAQEVGYDQLAPFFPDEFDWARITKATVAVRTLHAADDPELAPNALFHVERFVSKAGATATVLPTGGHFPTWRADQPYELPELPQAMDLVVELAN